ncbi:MAG: hypothetical protein ACLFMM_05005 [Methanohalobium sp.]|uniref:hypothetical protein n=1 Tax=Methanohalobium sp. TaxID=2837493 RepID=UPI00397E6B4B
MFNIDKPDADRKKFDEIGQKIWELHLDLVELKSQLDDRIVTLDENHMHLGYDNKVAGDIVTGLDNRTPKINTYEKSFRQVHYTGQDMDAGKLKRIHLPLD